MSTNNYQIQVEKREKLLESDFRLRTGRSAVKNVPEALLKQENNRLLFSKSTLGAKSSQKDFVVYNDKIFTNCIFYEFTFQSCIFSNCTFMLSDFKKCIFKKVTFDNCKFSNNLDTYIDYFRRMESCFFDDCLFYKVTFKNCMMENTIINASSFEYLEFRKSFLENSLFYGCSFLCRCVINESTIWDSKFISTDRLNIEFLNCEKAVNKGTSFQCTNYLISDPDINKISQTTYNLVSSRNMKEDYKERYLTFIKISDIFRKIGYTNMAWDYYYMGKKNEKKSLSGINLIFSTLADILCGYGEKPLNTFKCIVGNILLFGMFYLLCGFKCNNELIKFSLVSTFPTS